MRRRERNYLFADFDLSDSLRASQAGIQEQVDRIPPDGHLKIPHLWPGQNPPPEVSTYPPSDRAK